MKFKDPKQKQKHPVEVEKTRSSGFSFNVADTSVSWRQRQNVLKLEKELRTGPST